MRAPQIIIIALFAICLGMSLANNGKVRIRKESFGMTCVSVAIYTTLLWWGGFFGEGLCVMCTREALENWKSTWLVVLSSQLLIRLRRLWRSWTGG